LQREMEQVFGGVGRPVSIRALGRGAFPAITIGNRPDAIEVWALAPGIDPSKLEISIDRGLLTIAGERSADVPAETDKVNVYAKERFAGAFKRVISLPPEDADPARVAAQYRDGVLRITANRREEAKPRHIKIQ
ncbi:MAG: Hsp20/alpha crystallin family protein, partial [Beggiatoa sp.]|nr:Hsp20/alpha crystallin family protein [Beggiatoa sp.]